MRLSERDIEEINSKVESWNEGIFTEPNWIPDNIKEPVIYQRYEIGGVSGGSCWDNSNPQPYTINHVPNFRVLDEVLIRLCPDLSYLKYKQVESLINSNDKTEWEYYGNCTEYTVKYIVLSELYDLLGI